VAGYRTVFEVSYLGNNDLLLTSLGCLTLGVVVGRYGPRWVQGKPAGGRSFWWPWCAVWVTFAVILAGLSLSSGWAYTDALRAGECNVVEGTVEVLHRQPATGHDAGDLVRVGGQEFRVNYFHATAGYNRTLAHGGALAGGVRVRLHHLSGSLLKVEVAE
jgi:hypothetical protein